MNRKYRCGPGAALITLLAVVLAMSALGVLTLLSARGDEVLSERAARVAESVARLDARAEESLAALDAALAAAPTDQGEAAYRAAVAAALPEGMTLDAEAGVVRWVESAEDGRSLVCAAALAPVGEFPRLDWLEHRLVTELNASPEE